jgi:transglutaminase-like putative cysteine protease
MYPSPAFSSDGSDYFGNAVVLFTLQEPHQELTVEATSQVEVLARTLPEPGETPAWEGMTDRACWNRCARICRGQAKIFFGISS